MRQEREEARLAERVREHLDRRAGELPAPTVARLARARRRALAELEAGGGRAPARTGPRWMAAGSLAAAAAVLLAAGLWLARPAAGPAPLEALQDLELLSGAAGVDFYRELDFYAWLAEEAGAGDADGGA